jgi:transposase-like protein
MNAIAKKLKRQSKGHFKGRHFEAWLIVQAVTWYLRYPLSYRDLEEMFRERGFQSFNTARRTISGFEAMLWLRKGFGFSGGWTVNDQNDLLVRLFGIQKVNKA